MPEVPQCRIAFPGDLRLVCRQTGSTSCPGPILSGSEGPRGHKAVPGAPARAQGPVGWTYSPGPHALTSKSLRGRPAELGDWGPGPNALGIDQLTRVTRARVRMPVVSTTFPGDSRPRRRVRVVDQAFRRLRPVPEGPRFRPASRATLDRARCRGAEQLSQGTRTWTEGTRGRPAVPGDTGPGQRAHGFDQQSRGLVLGSEGLQV